MLFVKGQRIIEHHLTRHCLKEVQDKLEDQVTAKAATVRQVRKAPVNLVLCFCFSRREQSTY